VTKTKKRHLKLVKGGAENKARNKAEKAASGKKAAWKKPNQMPQKPQYEHPFARFMEIKPTVNNHYMRNINIRMGRKRSA
jgi:hypothetical protein